MKNYQEIRDLYLSRPLSFFNSLIANEANAVSDSEYRRIPVYTGSGIVLLMIWGKNGETAIHGHGGIDGTVKVIHGVVKEDKYEFTGTKLDLITSKIHFPGEILPEDTGTIHAITNQNDTFSVTLHIYHTEKNTLAGTVMFDPEKRRIGILNDLAKSTSWKENPKAFQAIFPFEQNTRA